MTDWEKLKIPFVEFYEHEESPFIVRIPLAEFVGNIPQQDDFVLLPIVEPDGTCGIPRRFVVVESIPWIDFVQVNNRSVDLRAERFNGKLTGYYIKVKRSPDEYELSRMPLYSETPS